MRFPQDADGWPWRDHARIVDLAPHRWHVQQAGTGPDILMIHGAGGATHSWRHLAPLLATGARATLVDLPGHGFTRSPRARSGLSAMAADLGALLRHLGLAPQAIIAHSAGAAVALHLSLDGAVPGARIVAINPALAPFGGLAGVIFPAMAKIMALTPLTASLFARTSTQATIGRLIAATGSTLDPEGHALYLRLARDPDHVAGTIAMMANWNLSPLLNRLADVVAPCHFLLADNDGTVPPQTGADAARRIPGCTVARLPGLGHLAQEEAPKEIAALIRAAIGLTD
jgi:magnesium chelatase accessory protein